VENAVKVLRNAVKGKANLLRKSCLLRGKTNLLTLHFIGGKSTLQDTPRAYPISTIEFGGIFLKKLCGRSHQGCKSERPYLRSD
jgi:hypothetical protein